MKAPRSRRDIVVLLGFLVAALVLAGVVSYYASSSPDGLNKVAIDQRFAGAEEPHDLENSPLAGYSSSDVDNERLSGGLAGVAGVGATLVLAGGLAMLVRRRSPPDETEHGAAGPVP